MFAEVAGGVHNYVEVARLGELHVAASAAERSLLTVQLQAAHATAMTRQRISESPTLRTLAAGATAGAVSRTCTAPVDRLKVLIQEGRMLHLSQSAMGHQRGGELARAAALATYVYRTEGVASFWSGNGVNCLKAGPEQAIAFTAREFFASKICSEGPKNATLTENFLCGALAGSTAQLILYPLEVVKTRMAVATKGEYSGIADCVRQSLRRNGLKDLYRGCAANMVGIAPHRGIDMGVFFTLEAAVKRSWGVSDGDLPVVGTLSCGIVASVVSQTVTYPLNLVRTKLQTQGVNGRPVRYCGIRDCLATIVREEGPRALFHGILPNMAKAVPATAISYVVFRKVTEQLAV